MLADAVVIVGGVSARLVAEKLKGPPAAPRVIFCSATVGVVVLSVLVSTQLICAPAKTFAAGMVTTLLANEPKLAGLPVIDELASVQLTEVAVKLAAGVSVMVTFVL